MIPLLLTVFAVLLFLFLIRRYQVRERRKELLLMKRHAASCADQSRPL